MQSIKVKKKTKAKIEETQAELLLKHSIKINQADLLDKIVETATDDPDFIQKIFIKKDPPIIPLSNKKIVDVEIVAKKKFHIKLFPDEWED